MPTVYVAGPVLRGGAQLIDSLVGRMYDAISGAAKELGIEARLPGATWVLEQADPASFFREIQQSIKDASVAISVFTSGDVSLGVESTIASYSGRRQLLLCPRGQHVPRLLSGLPGTVTLLYDPTDSLNVLQDRVYRFLKEAL